MIQFINSVWDNIHDSEFQIFRKYNFCSTSNNNRIYIESLLKKILKFFKIMEIYFSESVYIFFKQKFINKFLLEMQWILTGNKFSYEGSVVISNQFNRLKAFVVEQRLPTDQMIFQKLNAQIELLTSFDAEQFEFLRINESAQLS